MKRLHDTSETGDIAIPCQVTNNAQCARNAMYVMMRYASTIADPAQIHHILTECTRHLNTLYSARAYPYTFALFFATSDIFVNHMMPQICQIESGSFLCRLRLVCKSWYFQVPGAVTHLRLPTHNEENVDYYRRMIEIFPRADSIHSHCAILNPSLSDKYYTLRLDHVTRLEIEPDRIIGRDYQYSLTHWTNLTTLIFRHCDERIIDIECCTNLTHLDISSAPFDNTADLLKLTKLQHLCVRNWCKSEDDADELSLTRLTALRYLESDWAPHFVGYTGNGRFAVSGEYELWDREKEVVNIFCPGFWNGQLDGQWQSGVFTGPVYFRYFLDDECQCQFPCAYEFTGHLLNGKRHGPGEETYEHDRTCAKGHWLNGERDGHFDIYSSEAMSGSTQELVATEYWRHGQLQEARVDMSMTG